MNNELNHLYISDAERAACGLLSITDVTADPLLQHVQRALHDPDYDRLPPDVWDYSYDPPQIDDSETRHYLAYLRAIDQAVQALAGALAIHRQNQRREGDYTVPLTVALDESGPDIAVITSLGAAIVEFHQRVLNARGLYHLMTGDRHD